MANFDETVQWVNVTLPTNIDYNVAEKTSLSFLNPHGFMVGAFITEQVSGATGIVYNVLDVNNIEVARQSQSIEFPINGTVSDGVTSSVYHQRNIEHGVNNEVIQNLVDRTAYNKNNIEQLGSTIDELEDAVNGATSGIEDQIDGLETNVYNEINNIWANLKFEYLSESGTLKKNVTTSIVPFSGQTIVADFPSSPESGDWVQIIRGRDIQNSTVLVNPGGYKISGMSGTMEIDVPYKLIWFGFGEGNWYIVYQ